MNLRTTRLALRLAAATVITLGALRASAADDAAPAKAGWQPDPKQLEGLEQRKTTWLFREEGVPAYKLPDPLAAPDGSRITTAERWEKIGRPRTLDLFRQHVYGRPPAKPSEVSFETLATDPKAMDGRATMKRVKITSADAAGKSFAFEAAILVPNDATQPVPAFLLINNRPVASADPTRQHKNDFWPAEAIIARGYAAAVFRTNDVDPDKNGPDARGQGVRGVWPAGGAKPDETGKPAGDAWATIGAWAWGASRVLDYLETDPAVDAKRVAVVGHSRGGKTALWAGAQDERFALAVSNDSGCGGAALSRRKFGETVAAINRGFPYWFCENFKQFNGREEELPIDQHQLVALMAPRAAYVASADADFWADQRGEYLAIAHAAPVFALYGFEGLKPDEMPPLETPQVRGRTGYHIRKGGHGLTPYDWEQFMDFADRVWREKPAAAKAGG